MPNSATRDPEGFLKKRSEELEIAMKQFGEVKQL